LVHELGIGNAVFVPFEIYRIIVDIAVLVWVWVISGHGVPH
jgi:hypothetical protein